MTGRPPIEARWGRQPERWWLGRQLILRHDIETRAGLRAPGGTRVTVRKKFKGLWVQTERCPHCGVSFRVKEVSLMDLAWADGEPER